MFSCLISPEIAELMQPLPKRAHSFLPGFKYFVSHQAGFFCRKMITGVHDYRIRTGGGILLPDQYEINNSVRTW